MPSAKDSSSGDSQSSRRSRFTSWSAWMRQDIDFTSQATVALLLILSFIAGISDATEFIDYHVFVSNQTGNTIILAVSALNHKEDSAETIRHVGLALSGFIIGAFVLGQIGNVVGVQKRWWFVFSSFLQTLMNYAAAGLRYWYATGTHIDHTVTSKSYAVVFLLAVSSGGQLSLARATGVAEIPTGMITTALTDLMIDRKLVSFNNTARTRRLLFYLLFLMGGLVGAAAAAQADPALALLIQSIVKTFVTIAFAFVPQAHQDLPR